MCLPAAHGQGCEGSICNGESKRIRALVLFCATAYTSYETWVGWLKNDVEERFCWNSGIMESWSHCFTGRAKTCTMCQLDNHPQRAATKIFAAFVYSCDSLSRFSPGGPVYQRVQCFAVLTIKRLDILGLRHLGLQMKLKMWEGILLKLFIRMIWLTMVQGVCSDLSIRKWAW